MGFVTVPLHQVHIKNDLDSGCFNVAGRSALPVPGVAIIMGNNIAGGKVRPVLEVLKQPETSATHKVPQISPAVFPACVLTRLI